jgi:hypothetical protein
MIADPLKILTKRIRVRTLISTALLIIYIGFSLLLFFQWVGPSLDGSTDLQIGADSSTYLYFADTLRKGIADPIVITSLTTFPNNLWCPVLLALALKSTFAMVLANYAMFFLALALLKKSYSFSARIFVVLLLLNATTTVSLLTVNKEIVDFLLISIFLFAIQNKHNGLLVIVVPLALITRYEICIVMLLYLLAKSGFNPWARRRFLTLVALAILLSVMLPLFASKLLAARFEEAMSGGLVTWLDSLEMHYLYVVAVIPKIAENLFGEIVNVSSKWKTFYDSSNIANSYILLSNNLANVIVLIVLARKRRLSLRSDVIYLTMLGSIVMATSLVIQPRYFYFAYVLLCLRAAQIEARKPAMDTSPHIGGGVESKILLTDLNEAAFG